MPVGPIAQPPRPGPARPADRADDAPGARGAAAPAPADDFARGAARGVGPDDAGRAALSELGPVGRSRAPYAALAARARFTGYVTTARGQDVYVNIAPGKNVANDEPIVMLDGIAARHDRNGGFADALSQKGQTVVQLYLTGQGETLVRDLEKGGRSLNDDIPAEAQVRTVIDTLDALGVQKPVTVAGISYGGAIAAACRAEAPERFSKVLLVAPFIESSGKSSPMYDFMVNNPWNPMGPAMYRSAAKVSLMQGFPVSPAIFAAHPGAFHEGLLRLSMGLESFTLAGAVRDVENVHFLVVPEDDASPRLGNARASRAARSGSFRMASAEDAGKHDLVRANPDAVIAWMLSIMKGDVKAAPFSKD
jgi:pimeloyl-ACP methyl ester carboxylesterase